MKSTNISGRTAFAAVLGQPVVHSKSPAIHNAAFAALGIDAAYMALDVDSDNLATLVSALRAVNCLGASVTVPHKEAVVGCCDEVAESAREVGVANTLVFKGGKVVGHNTDAMGYVRALEEEHGSLAGVTRAVVLGGGGAARAVAYGLEKSGVQDISIVVRSPDKVLWKDAFAWNRENLMKLCGQAQLLVDATSIGLSEEREKDIPAPIPLGQMPKGAIVSSLIYHRKTLLLQEAEACGLRLHDGAGMLVHQGAIAFELWTGKKAPLEAMHKAMQAG